MIGREKEVPTPIHILARRRKNNPILLGDPGSVKQPSLKDLQRKLYEEVLEMLADAEVYSLDLGLVNGTRYRGDFEERVRRVVKVMQQKKMPSFSLMRFTCLLALVQQPMEQWMHPIC